MTKEEVLQVITDNITDNNSGAITAAVMRDTLNTMVEYTPEMENVNLDGYLYISTATPSTTPMTIANEDKVFYIAVEEGDYSNFSLGTISELSIIKSENGGWKIEELGVEFNSIVLDLLADATVVINTAIRIDGSFQAVSSGCQVYKIENKNYSIVSGKASTFSLQYNNVAFYSGEPSASTFISGNVQKQNYILEDFDLEVPQETMYICVSQYTGTQAECSTKVSGLLSLEQKTETLEQKTETLEQSINSIVHLHSPEILNTDAFDLQGYYSSTDTSFKSYGNYVSTPLILVKEGDVISWHNWTTNTLIANAQAIALYDNDGLPYNGKTARCNYKDLTTQDYANGEFSLVIPKNCSQIGFSHDFSAYPVQEGGYVQIGESGSSLNPDFINLIKMNIGDDGRSNNSSANYYLKGNSNIVSNNKKLGIIAAGQSNIEGRNSYSDLPSDFINPNTKVHYCSNINGLFSDFKINDAGAGNDWGFDAILYDTLTNPNYGNQSEIYVIKKAMGGTSIDKYGATDYHWTADYEYLPSENYSLLRTFENIIRKAKETQGDNFEIKAFVWHQGEGDSDSQEVANRYYDNLRNMLAYVRGIVGNPRLQFFCGTISNNNNANKYKDIINEAYNRLAQEDPYFHLVDMSNAVLEDSWHFNYQWSIYFGEKVYDLMVDVGIIEGVKINPAEPI